MTQASIFTSIEARKKILPTIGTLQRQVYDYLCQRGDLGATDEEIQKSLDMNPNTQRPRRVELQRAGEVVDSGRTRKTQSGRSAAVWVTKENA